MAELSSESKRQMLTWRTAPICVQCPVRCLLKCAPLGSSISKGNKHGIERPAGRGAGGGDPLKLGGRHHIPAHEGELV